MLIIPSTIQLLELQGPCLLIIIFFAGKMNRTLG